MIQSYGKNGRAIYPVGQTDGGKAIFLSVSFACNSKLTESPVPQCPIRLHATGPRTIFVSDLRFLPGRLQRHL